MKKILVIVVISIICSVVVVLSIQFFDKTKIGFVRSGLIIQQYKGMIEANEKFAEEIKMVLTNIDTLKNRYERLKASESSIPLKQKTEWAYKLGISHNEFEKYDERSKEQLELRKDELTKKVLEKINVFIQDYGKMNN